MARSLISSPSFLGTPLPSLSRHGVLPQSRRISTKVKFSLHNLPPIDNSIDFNAVYERAESLLYTLADAAVAADGGAAASDSTAGVVQKSGGWFGFISDAMEVVLKFKGLKSNIRVSALASLMNTRLYLYQVLKDGLATVHVPYAYGFAIILLTVLVKVATFPLTKQQVESTLAMQNLQPKIKAIQQRYAGNQERIQLETSRLYKQAGVNPLAGTVLIREFIFLSNSDGHPPLGWHDTAAYLVLPVLLVVSQFVSMEIMKPPQDASLCGIGDDTSLLTMLIFVEAVISHTHACFHNSPQLASLTVICLPAVLTQAIEFTNNVLSTAQQVWLRKLGGAKPAVSENASGIISAGRAKRSGAQPEQKGERFKQLKEEEKKKKSKALPADDLQASASADSDSEDDSDNETESKQDKEVLEEAYASSSVKPVPSEPRRSKRSKRKRADKRKLLSNCCPPTLGDCEKLIFIADLDKVKSFKEPHTEKS
ncbi:hypothetical protein DH2020_000072 [Rehmannia glutinosa]|uniref:Membrane insertase YidC/Oxa/ALB C-terminal domain-containing protein n=1 Tax=Rehmannia glutinosa TaxID=99300 RepID=A0ABR0XVW4_REHGL